MGALALGHCLWRSAGRQGVCGFVRHNLPALDILHNDLSPQAPDSDTAFDHPETTPPLEFKDRIELRDIVYYYPNTSTPTVNNLNLEIKSKTTVGFVGVT